MGFDDLKKDQNFHEPRPTGIDQTADHSATSWAWARSTTSPGRPATARTGPIAAARCPRRTPTAKPSSVGRTRSGACNSRPGKSRCSLELQEAERQLRQSQPVYATGPTTRQSTLDFAINRAYAKALADIGDIALESQVLTFPSVSQQYAYPVPIGQAAKGTISTVLGTGATLGRRADDDDQRHAGDVHLHLRTTARSRRSRNWRTT